MQTLPYKIKYFHDGCKLSGICFNASIISALNYGVNGFIHGAKSLIDINQDEEGVFPFCRD